MSLIELLVVLVIVGVLLWLVNTMIPMDDKIKTIINVIVLIIVVLWVLQSFGLIGSVHGNLNDIRVR